MTSIYFSENIEEFESQKNEPSPYYFGHLNAMITHHALAPFLFLPIPYLDDLIFTCLSSPVHACIDLPL